MKRKEQDLLQGKPLVAGGGGVGAGWGARMRLNAARPGAEKPRQMLRGRDYSKEKPAENEAANIELLNRRAATIASRPGTNVKGRPTEVPYEARIERGDRSIETLLTQRKKRKGKTTLSD